jgi:drug/metabolite transporter (DMT)-like permease
MIAFAGNSLLCRAALSATGIDAASFTSIRLASGSIALYLLMLLRQRALPTDGNWPSALALFAYAAGFSFAYISLPAATGALLLFGAVQATMIGYGFYKGERLNVRQGVGIVLALLGLTALLLPGAERPSLLGAIFMLGAGIAWGVYSLRGRGAGDPTRETAGNFLRSLPLTAAVSFAFVESATIDAAGVAYAVASGALASGMGYALWYAALPHLTATTAATVQLSAPALAAIGGVVLLSEPLTIRLGLATIAILGGIAIFILSKGAVVHTPQAAADANGRRPAGGA